VTQSISTAAQAVREGEIIAGKYRVERVLGVGGMGVVVAAHHVQLDEKVAIKFLLPQMLKSPEVVARFAREARAAVKIKSEHVARVHDVGTLETGAPYMVMEYLEGGDLAAMLQQKGALPIEQAVEFVLQACVAVADAHALGIVHRDLKPANLFCVRRTDGQLSIKVLDFGISKTLDTSGMSSGSFTRTSAMMGSPLYMSPEQMRTPKDIDTRSDLWALGMILFELTTGRPAFEADTMTELVLKVTSEPVPSIRTLRPDVPEGLEAVVLKCLEKDRTQRYPNVAELALGLLPFAPKRAKASVERITGIIQAAGLSKSALALPSTPKSKGTKVSAGGSTDMPVSSTQPGRTTVGSKASAIVAMLALAAVVAFIGVGVVYKTVFASKPSAAVVAAAPATASTSTPVPVVANVVPTTSAPSASVAAQPASSPPASVSPPPRSAPLPPAAQRPTPKADKAAATAATGAKPNCDPNYTIDALGHKNFKPECFN
jgi:serine/threonine-protein kinase